MSAPTRFPNGVTDRGPVHPLAQLPVLDPSKHYIFYDDFDRFTTSASGVTGWHEDTTADAGTSAAVTDAFGGVVAFTQDGAAGDNFHYQWAMNMTVHEVFTTIAGKKAWLRTRFKVEDADEQLPIIGLHIAADDPWGTEPSDQFLFRTLSANPDALQFAAGATNSTEVTVALGDLEDDTWVTVTAYYDGKNTVHCWRETDAGVITAAGSVSVTSSTAGDLLPNTEMTVAFGAEAVDTGADVFSIDFIMAVRER